jgi:hypothetical protein
MRAPELVRSVLPRVLRSIPLPPLDADAYLVWLWKTNDGQGEPMTGHQWWLVFQEPAGLTEEEGRKAIVSMAAHSRRRQRLQRMAAMRRSVLAP